MWLAAAAAGAAAYALSRSMRAGPVGKFPVHCSSFSSAGFPGDCFGSAVTLIIGLFPADFVVAAVPSLPAVDIRSLSARDVLFTTLGSARAADHEGSSPSPTGAAAGRSPASGPRGATSHTPSWTL